MVNSLILKEKQAIFLLTSIAYLRYFPSEGYLWAVQTVEFVYSKIASFQETPTDTSKSVRCRCSRNLLLQGCTPNPLENFHDMIRYSENYPIFARLTHLKEKKVAT